MPKFSRRMGGIKASDIREILKVTARPEVISFAGGLPADELFPMEEVRRANERVMDIYGPAALQYSTSEGFAPLREWLSKRMAEKFEADYTADEVLITSGSQQGIDLVSKVFLDAGDVVLCENPTYLAALSAFKAYEARVIDVATDDGGMVIADLEAKIAAHDNIKILYMIPDFQNPTGKTWTEERRRRVVELCAANDIMVVEDNPYKEVRFEGEAVRSARAFDETGCVIYLGTFSKTLCPGLRVAWIGADAAVTEKLILVKQSTDLQCNTFAQLQVYEILQLLDPDAHIAKIGGVYKKRRDVALCAIEEHFPARTTFTVPEGGLFIWVQLAEDIDTKELLAACIERNVAFVPGQSFFAREDVKNALRINFSNMDEGRIQTGLGVMGSVIGGQA